MAIGSPTEAAIRFLIGADLDSLHAEIEGLRDAHQRVLDFQHALADKAHSVASAAASGIHHVSDAVHARVATTHEFVHSFHRTLESGAESAEKGLLSLLSKAHHSLERMVHSGVSMNSQFDHMAHGAHATAAGLDTAAESAKNLNKHLKEGHHDVNEMYAQIKEIGAGLKEGVFGSAPAEAAREYLEQMETVEGLVRTLGKMSKEQQDDFFDTAFKVARELDYLRSPKELVAQEVYGVREGIPLAQKGEFAKVTTEAAFHLEISDIDAAKRYIALRRAGFSPEDIELAFVEQEALVRSSRTLGFQTPITATRAGDIQAGVLPMVETLPAEARPRAMVDLMAGVAGFESMHLDQQTAIHMMGIVRQGFRTREGRAILGGLAMLGMSGEKINELQVLADRGEFAEAGQALADSLRTYEQAATPDTRLQMQDVLAQSGLLSLDQIMRLGQAERPDIQGAAKQMEGQHEFAEVEISTMGRVHRMGNQISGLWSDLGRGFGEAVGHPLTVAIEHTQRLVDLFYKIPDPVRHAAEAIFGLAAAFYGQRGLLHAGRSLWKLFSRGGAEGAAGAAEGVARAALPAAAEEAAVVAPWAGFAEGSAWAGLGGGSSAAAMAAPAAAAAPVAEGVGVAAGVGEAAAIGSKGLGATGVGLIVTAVIELTLWANRFREAGGFTDMIEGWRKVNETGEGSIDLYRRLNEKLYETAGWLKYLPSIAIFHKIEEAILPSEKVATEWEQTFHGIMVVGRSMAHEMGHAIEVRLHDAWTIIKMAAGATWVFIRDQWSHMVDAIKHVWEGFVAWIKDHTPHWLVSTAEKVGEAWHWAGEKISTATRYWGDFFSDPLSGVRGSMESFRQVGAADIALHRQRQVPGHSEGREGVPLGEEHMAPVLTFPRASAHQGAHPGKDIYESAIAAAAQQHGVPADLIREVMRHESQFDPGAVSNRGAMGLMQLEPSTAAQLGVKDSGQLLDPATNIMTGAKYLRQLMDEFGGRTDLVLAAYNAGPAAVQKYGGIPPYKETQGYVRDIQSHLASLHDTGMEHARQQIVQVQQAGVERKLDTTNETLVQIRDYLAKREAPRPPGISAAGRALASGAS